MGDQASDVRVKLSAEGLSEVVSAFRTANKEGSKAGHGISEAFHEAGETLKEAGKELIAFVALGAVIEKFKESFEGIFENAEVVQNFAKATGLSTDAVQGLQAAAKDAGVDIGTVESGVNKLTITIGKAASGVSAAIQPFDQLGIKFDDFKKLSPDEQLKTVIQKLGEMKDPAQRAAVGVALFGKQFQDLEPVIEEVSEKGLQSYIDHLREIGVLMDSDTVAAIKNVGDQLLEVRQRAEGITTQFVTGLIPGLEKGMDAFLKASNDGADGIRTVGEGVGALFKGLVFVAIVVGKTIGAVIAAAVETTKGYIDATKNALNDLVNGDYSKAGKSFSAGFAENGRQLKQILATVKQDAADAAESLFGGDEKDKPKDPEGGGHHDGGGDADNLAKLKAVAQARYQLLSAQLDSELQLYTAQATLRSAQEKQQYEDGKISLQQYFSDRAKIIEEQFDKEIATLQKKRAAAAAVPESPNDQAEALQRQAQIAQIDGQIALKQIARQQALAQNTQEQRAAQRQLYIDQLNAEGKLASLQGRRYDAQRAQLAVQLQQLDEVLRKAGTAEEVRQKALDTAREQGEALARFNEQSFAADAAMTSLNTDLAGIQDQINNGVIFQADGEQQMLTLEQQRLPLLQKIADAQLAAAQASKDPQAIAAAEAFQQKLRDIGTATNQAGRDMATFKQGAQDALQGGLVDVITNADGKITSLKSGLKSLFSTILDGIRRVAAQLAAQAAVRAIFGSFGGGSIPSTGGADYIRQGIGDITFSAKGNAFSGGKVVKAFAAGGAFTNSIASQPTIAPMVMFGEAGDEAIMPLTRDSNGRLGVRSQGSGGDVNVTTQIVIDGSGNASGQSSGGTDALRQFGDMISNGAKNTISREMQPGGLLWRWRNQGG